MGFDILSCWIALRSGPHAPALDRGIDSVTIEVTFADAFDYNDDHVYGPGLELVQKVEHLIRALSNLHERLHHSATQYLLPSSKKFVSLNEYIWPNVLLLLPLVVRAVSLLFAEMMRLSFSLSFQMVVVWIGSCIVLGVMSTLIQAIVNERDSVLAMNTIVVVVYGCLLMLVRRRQQEQSLPAPQSEDMSAKLPTNPSKSPGRKDENYYASLQFIVCLMALYCHVPLALSNVSLALPSVMLWCPLLAFPKYGCCDGTSDKMLKKIAHLMQKLIKISVLWILWPPMILVPYVFRRYTVYLLMVYLPLHFVLVLLWLT